MPSSVIPPPPSYAYGSREHQHRLREEDEKITNELYEGYVQIYIITGITDNLTFEAYAKMNSSQRYREGVRARAAIMTRLRGNYEEHCRESLTSSAICAIRPFKRFVYAFSPLAIAALNEVHKDMWNEVQKRHPSLTFEPNPGIIETLRRRPGAGKYKRPSHLEG